MASLIEHYNWQAALVTLIGVIVLTKIAKYLAFKVPDLAEMRRVNLERDKPKYAQPKYPPVVKGSQRVGLYCNLAFFVVLAPYCINLQPTPWYKVLLDLFIVLMVYDFFYYLSHRFWFHGNGWMRKIHAVHHQARSPTYIDALYVHPFETFIGLSLFIGTVFILGLVTGGFHAITAILAYVIFTQLNTINHTFVDLPKFPFRTLSWITAKHHKHHENMHMGNYATITLFYDKLFGTFE